MSNTSVNRYSEVAKRYATALFGVVVEKKQEESVLESLRGLKSVFSKGDIKEFLESPLVHALDREKALRSTLTPSLEKKEINEDLYKFILLLVKKNRISLFSEIVEAFQDRIDQANGVTRGTVRSANILLPEERQQVEEIVHKATGKKVILTYKEDASVIGGLVAEVGSYTFNDSIDFHLKKMKEELNRRTH